MATTQLPVVTESPDFVAQLLSEQQSLTAVERFSRDHDAGNLEFKRGQNEPDQARYYRNLMPASPPAPGQQLAFEVDLDACSGCKACVVACHTMNGLEEEESWRRVGTVVADAEAVVSGPAIQHVTTACHHCEDPGCLNGCPVKAYDKDPVTGIVRHLDDQCIGCKYCTMMCPYEVPKYSDRLGIVRKCDMCHQRLSVGEAPACVQSCPNEAIKITVVDVDTTLAIPAEARLAAGAPDSAITRPTTVYKSERLAEIDASVPQDQGVDPVAEDHWPLAGMLVGTQVAVGLILAERCGATLALLTGEEYPEMATRVASLVALAVAGAGMGAAPLHLGQPLRAWRVFLGLRTSWLSREAIVLGKFMGLLSVAVALLWLPVLLSFELTAGLIPEAVLEWIPAWAGKAAWGLSIPLGIVGLYTSAMIYIATKRQLWRPQRTFTRFFGSAVTGGSAAATSVLALTSAPASVVAVTASVAIVSGMSKLIWEWQTHLSSAPKTDPYDHRSSRLVARSLVKLKQQRVIGGMAGAAILAAALAVLGVLPVAAGVLAAIAALLMIGGEFAERLLYFSSVVYDRMPGTLR
ncbi:MAG: DmsC/YnfH family molybdoenzyme membrane anchor subunit [Planctomycetota bacterium]